MYRRSKFLEVLLNVRQEMAREADYDVDLFAEMIRSGLISKRSSANRSGKGNRARRETDMDSGPASDG